MKIAIFSDTYAPDINGVATSSRILRNELVRSGHEVVVVTSELPTDSDYVDNPEDNIIRVPGLELKRFYGYRSANIYSFKIMKELRRQEIELVHCQTEFGIGIFSRIVAEALDIPIIYTYHTMWVDYSHYITPGRSTAVEGLIKRVITRMSKFYGGRCSELIVPSNKTAVALKEYGLDKTMHIIPTGLELYKFDTAKLDMNKKQEIIDKYQLQGKFVMTFLGRIAREKSIDLILETISNIKEFSKPFCFLIVGSGPGYEEIQNKVKELNLQHLVTFTGMQVHEMVPYFYDVSDIFISASLSETQGLTFIESMATKTPVLARYDDNLVDVIQNGYNGYFFNDGKELEELIVKVIESDLTTLSNNALESTKKFSSEVFCNKVLEVYQRAIDINYKDYVVTKIKDTDLHYSAVHVKVDNEYMLLSVSNEDIERLGLSSGKIINSKIMKELQDNENIVKIYNKALRYLTYRDYSKNQLKQKLLSSSDFTEYQVDSTISILEQKNLINDYEYAMSYLKRCMNQKTGINKAVHYLIDCKVSTQIIDECIELLEDDEEYDAALDLIDNAYLKGSQFSYKTMIQKIREKLYLKGFTVQTIERAMNDYNFEFSYENEIKALENDYEKVFTKYRRKVSNKELHDKVINALLKKGYNYDDIKSIMSERE